MFLINLVVAAFQDYSPGSIWMMCEMMAAPLQLLRWQGIKPVLWNAEFASSTPSSSHLQKIVRDPCLQAGEDRRYKKKRLDYSCSIGKS